jgi:hypothetical protein
MHGPPGSRAALFFCFARGRGPVQNLTDNEALSVRGSTGWK